MRRGGNDDIGVGDTNWAQKGFRFLFAFYYVDDAFRRLISFIDEALVSATVLHFIFYGLHIATARHLYIVQ